MTRYPAKAGSTRMVMHRPIVGKVRNVTVSTVAGDWFASIQAEHERAVVPVNRGVEIGIDLGGVQPIVMSDGTVVNMPRITKKGRKRLATAQRALARRTKGSRNRAKARRRVARLQAKFAMRRKDALHKATTTIVKSHGVIVIEDLKVKDITKTGKGTVEAPGNLVRKKANQNRSLLDVSPRMIRTMLDGSRIVVVDPALTSQCCSACGTVDAASRISRSRFVCTGCGSIDADVNAAKNILKIGVSPTAGPPGMPYESSQNRPEAGRRRSQEQKLGPSGPRIVTSLSRRAR